MHHVVTQPSGNHLAQLVLRDAAQTDQNLPDQAVQAPIAFMVLQLQGIADCAGLHDAGVDQGFAQVFSRAGQRMRRAEQLPQRLVARWFKMRAGCRRVGARL